MSEYNLESMEGMENFDFLFNNDNTLVGHDSQKLEHSGEHGKQQSSYGFEQHSNSGMDESGQSFPVDDIGMPMLTPDASDSSRTDSNNLHAANPEYAYMSPLQMAFHQSVEGDLLQQGQNMQSMSNAEYEEEYFFTPLISPAITPQFNMNHNESGMMPNDGMNFSPLTSPALVPHSPRMFATTQMNMHVPQSYNSMSSQSHHTMHANGPPTSPVTTNSTNNASRATRSKPTKKGVMTPNASPYQQPVSKGRRKMTLHQQALQYPNLQPGSVAPAASSSVMMPPPAHAPAPINTHLSSKRADDMDHSPVTTMPPPSSLPPSFSIDRQRADNQGSGISPATPASLMNLRSGNSPNPASNGASPNSPHSNPSPTAMSNSADTVTPLPEPMIPMKSGKTSSRKRSSAPGVSPALLPSLPITSPGLGPMASPRVEPRAMTSPRALRPSAMSSSPRTLKPLISPSLKPLLPGNPSLNDAAQILASKSNYQNLREGKAQSLGISYPSNIHSGIEIRKTAHKAAEQKRRDSLKQNFESLRAEILEAAVALCKRREKERLGVCGDVDSAVESDTSNGSSDSNGESKSNDTLPTLNDIEKEVKQMSKVLLLRHSYDYILRLKCERAQRDARIDSLLKEIRNLRAKCGLAELTPEALGTLGVPEVDEKDPKGRMLELIGKASAGEDGEDDMDD
ncbi:hypothetical protein BZG36_00123 [Bifiguratus adelaidae]|uniref:BHLH domain-containing protein n=1 Tax=Bifiguratus adelaidae TaxID=1938954 RepID=A0A261Y8B7_9FUNG|nr:hypothetical protein BZG36_00123 [Bifiguratus adelaidae]